MPNLDNAYALVIGTADYATIRKLPKVRDAEDLAAALVDPSLCGYDPKNVTVILDQDATGDNIRAGLDPLKDCCDADSTAFISFAGLTFVCFVVHSYRPHRHSAARPRESLQTTTTKHAKHTKWGQ
jgi:hypothetical protein